MQILSFALWQEGRYGSKGEVAAGLSHFRFAPETGHRLVRAACLKSAITGRAKHLGFMSKRPAQFSLSASHNMVPIVICF
jgi:hypothetical protein